MATAGKTSSTHNTDNQSVTSSTSSTFKLSKILPVSWRKTSTTENKPWETCVVTINRKYESEENVQAFQDGMGKYSYKKVKEKNNKIKFHLKIHDLVKAVNTIEKMLESHSQRIVESKDVQVVEKSKKGLSQGTEKESSSGLNKKSEELCRHLSPNEYKALEYLLGKDFTNAVKSVEKNNNGEIISVCAKNKADRESIERWLSSLRQVSLTLTSEELGKLGLSVDTKSAGVKAFIEVQNDEGRVVIYAFDYAAIKTSNHTVEVKSEKRKLINQGRPDVVIHTNHTFVEQTKNLYTKSGIKVSVYKVDLTHLPVDAIVNAANGQLNHGGGVAAAIARAAGEALELEGNDYIKTHGPLKVTEVLSTTAGNLPCKSVFHAVGPRWVDYEDKELCQQDLEQTVFNAFKKAHDMTFTSLAVSSISSAIFGVPKEMCARMYLAGIQRFDRQHGGNTSLKYIHFVDVNDEMVRIIQKVFTQFWHSDFQPFLFQRQSDNTNKQNSPTVQVNSSRSQKGESSNTKSSSTDNSKHFDFKGINLFLQQRDIPDYPEDVVIVVWQEPGCFELDNDQFIKMGGDINGNKPSFNFIEDGKIKSFTLSNGRIIFFPAMSWQSIDADKVSGMTEKILDKVQQERKRSVVIPCSPFVHQTVPNASNNSLGQFCKGIHKGIRRYLEHRNVYITVDNSEIMNMMADKINLLFGEIKESKKSRSNDGTYCDQTVGHDSFKPSPNPTSGTTHDSNKESSIWEKGRLSEKTVSLEPRETCVVTIKRKYLSEENVQAFLDGMGKYSCKEVKEEKNKIKFHLNIHDLVKAVKTIEKILESHSQRRVESKDAQVVEKSKKGLSQRTEKESSPGLNKKLCRHLSPNEYKALEYLLGKDFTNAVKSVEKNNNGEIVSVCAKNKADKERIDHWLSSLRQESLTLTSEELGKLEGFVDTKSAGVKAFIAVQNNEGRVVIHAFDYDAIKTAKHMVEVKSEKRKLTILKRPPDVEIHTNHTVVEQTKDLYTNSGIKVSVYKADITHLIVDAIVNNANGQLNHGGGVAAAIARAAGADLEDGGEDYIKTHEPLKVTEVLSTTAGNLPCKKVIHAVGPHWDDYDDKELCQKYLEETVFNAFKKAHDMMFTSLAVSSISSGIFGVPKEMCARMYLAGIQRFDRQHGGNTSLKYIHFVDVNDEMVGIIQEVFTQFWHSDFQPFFFERQRDDTNKQNSQTVQVNSSESQKGKSSNTKSSSTDNSRHFDFKGITLFLQQQDISDFPEDVIVVWQEPGRFKLDMNQIMKMGGDINGNKPSFDFIEDGEIKRFTLNNRRIIFFSAMSWQSIDADKVSGMTERILDKVQQERKRSVVIPYSPYVPQTVPNANNNSLEQFCEGIHKGIRRYLDHRNVYITVDNTEIMNMMADKINLLFGEIKEEEKSRSNDGTCSDHTTQTDKVTVQGESTTL